MLRPSLTSGRLAVHVVRLPRPPGVELRIGSLRIVIATVSHLVRTRGPRLHLTNVASRPVVMTVIGRTAIARLAAAPSIARTTAGRTTVVSLLIVMTSATSEITGRIVDDRPPTVTAMIAIGRTISRLGLIAIVTILTLLIITVGMNLPVATVHGRPVVSFAITLPSTTRTDTMAIGSAILRPSPTWIARQIVTLTGTHALRGLWNFAAVIGFPTTSIASCLATLHQIPSVPSALSGSPGTSSIPGQTTRWHRRSSLSQWPPRSTRLASPTSRPSPSKMNVNSWLGGIALALPRASLMQVVILTIGPKSKSSSGLPSRPPRTASLPFRASSRAFSGASRCSPSSVHLGALL